MKSAVKAPKTKTVMPEAAVAKPMVTETAVKTAVAETAVKSVMAEPSVEPMMEPAVAETTMPESAVKSAVTKTAVKAVMAAETEVKPLGRRLAGVGCQQAAREDDGADCWNEWKTHGYSSCEECVADGGVADRRQG